MAPPPGTLNRAGPRLLFARQRWHCVRRYLGLDHDAWFRVVGRDGDGIWIEGPGIGDPLRSPNQRFVFGEDFEYREDAG